MKHIIAYMRYFGTDGIRGLASDLLEEELPYFLGLALSKRGGKILVARDVREHSVELEKQLCRGLLAGDAQIWLTGVLPTPALAYTAKSENAEFAVMITASHNPPAFNGLKVFGRGGKKLPSALEEELDAQIVALKTVSVRPDAELAQDESAADELSEEELCSELDIKPVAHRIRIVSGAQELYARHVVASFPRFDGMKVRLDLAHGCFAKLAKGVFEALGASVVAENDVRDGKRVNVDCGSTRLDRLVSHMKRDEIGFAFDGDGDRVLAVVDGKPYDGDAILLALSTLYRIQGKLRKRFVVGTVLTNSRLQRELAYHNTVLVRAEVGDKHVLDALTEAGCLLGGEKSGHILMLDRADTGDGLITALSLLEVKKTIGSLPAYLPYPMTEFNVPARDPRAEMESEGFKKKLALAERSFGKKGRLVARPSGTEPYVRIAYECFSQDAENIFKKLREIFL